MDHCESFPIVGSSHIISIHKQKRMSMGECMSEEMGGMRRALRGRERDYLSKTLDF
jgi:hypothetical protein